MDDPLAEDKARLQASQQQREDDSEYAMDRTRAGIGIGRATSSEKRPLIEETHNQWQFKKSSTVSYGTAGDNERDFGFCDLEKEDGCPGRVRDCFNSRRIRSMIAFVLLCAVGFWYIWSQFVQPSFDESWEYKEGFAASQTNGTYDMAKGGHGDKDLVRIKYLSHDLLPGGPADPAGKRRLVFIGDVHGCKKELQKLLKKVDFRKETDHLVLVGDTISKGPDNVGVLDELIRLNATSVRGNHEDRVLHVAKKIHAQNEPTFSEQLTPVAATSSKGFAKDAAIVKRLKPHHLQYLRDMPLMLHIPSLPMSSGSTKKVDSPITEHILVVHAGLVPGVRLEKQDPYFVMNMRSINRRTHVPSVLRDGKNAKPWYDIWCWYNDKIFKRSSLSVLGSSSGTSDDQQPDEPSSYFSGLWKGFFGRKTRPRPQVVIYGHDSKTGLVINRWSKGLDSGCVGGGKLTALVLDAKGKSQFSHVGCKNYRD